MKKLYGLHEKVDPVSVAMRVIEGVYDGVTTSELDNLAAEVAATNAVNHPDMPNSPPDRRLQPAQDDKKVLH